MSRIRPTTALARCQTRADNASAETRSAPPRGAASPEWRPEPGGRAAGHPCAPPVACALRSTVRVDGRVLVGSIS